MAHQHTEAKGTSPKKRETLKEPHCMFCGICPRNLRKDGLWRHRC